MNMTINELRELAETAKANYEEARDQSFSETLLNLAGDCHDYTITELAKLMDMSIPTCSSLMGRLHSHYHSRTKRNSFYSNLRQKVKIELSGRRKTKTVYVALDEYGQPDYNKKIIKCKSELTYRVNKA